jgi:hypothetical protein
LASWWPPGGDPVQPIVRKGKLTGPEAVTCGSRRMRPLDAGKLFRRLLGLLVPAAPGWRSLLPARQRHPSGPRTSRRVDEAALSSRLVGYARSFSREHCWCVGVVSRHRLSFTIEAARAEPGLKLGEDARKIPCSVGERSSRRSWLKVLGRISPSTLISWTGFSKETAVLRAVLPTTSGRAGGRVRHDRVGRPLRKRVVRGHSRSRCPKSSRGPERALQFCRTGHQDSALDRCSLELARARIRTLRTGCLGGETVAPRSTRYRRSSSLGPNRRLGSEPRGSASPPLALTTSGVGRRQR